MADHPVKVPPELAEQLWSESADKPAECNTFRAHVFAQSIADWAADRELEAVEHWLITGPYGASIAASAPNLVADLRTAMRPKPPTLAEQGMEELELLKGDANSVGMGFGAPAITAALNRLAELEAQQ